MRIAIAPAEPYLREPLVTKCANPSCGTLFRYFRGGKLFLLELPPATPKSGPFEPATEFCKRIGDSKFFWLCEQCAKDMTIVSEAGRFIVTHKDNAPQGFY